MNIWRNATRRLEEEIANAWAPPCGDQVPPLEEDINDDQATVSAPPLTDGDIRVAFLHIDESITTHAQDTTT